MNEIEISGNAKINLALDVTGKRPDGYHEVRMIMQSIGLHDTIRIRKSAGSIIGSKSGFTASGFTENIQILTNSKKIPCDRRNIAYKAAEVLKSKYQIKDGVSIHINKRIPVAAGLAGGSTDAAAVIKGLNELFSLGLSISQLCEIGAGIGADVPFCIMGASALAEGIGEILTPVPGLPDSHIILVKPAVGVSTARVYGNLKLDQIKERPDIDEMIRYLVNKDLKKVCAAMGNVLETVTIPEHPAINDIKKKMLETGAVGSMMSGSGPTVFGIFEDQGCAEKAYEAFTKDYQEVHMTKPV